MGGIITLGTGVCLRADRKGEIGNKNKCGSID